FAVVGVQPIGLFPEDSFSISPIIFTFLSKYLSETCHPRLSVYCLNSISAFSIYTGQLYSCRSIYTCLWKCEWGSGLECKLATTSLVSLLIITTDPTESPSDCSCL